MIDPKFTFSHYCKFTMNAQKLAEFSDWAAMVIKRNCGARYYPCLLYSGMSGISLATGISLSMHNNYGITPAMIYVRKTREKSHGYREESMFSSTNAKQHIAYFVDDFISSGKTFKRCLKSLDRWETLPGNIPKFHKTKIIVTSSAERCKDSCGAYDVFEFNERKKNQYKLYNEKTLFNYGV
jgi:hypothetical protein